MKIYYISEISYFSTQHLSQYKNRINHDDRRFFYTRGSLNLKQFIHPRGKYLIYNEKNAKNYSKKKNVATVYVLQQY